MEAKANCSDIPKAFEQSRKQLAEIRDDDNACVGNETAIQSPGNESRSRQKPTTRFRIVPSRQYPSNVWRRQRSKGTDVADTQGCHINLVRHNFQHFLPREGEPLPRPLHEKIGQDSDQVLYSDSVEHRYCIVTAEPAPWQKVPLSGQVR